MTTESIGTLESSPRALMQSLLVKKNHRVGFISDKVADMYWLSYVRVLIRHL